MKKQEKKPIIYYFVRYEKPSKYNYKTRKENQILIKDKNEISGSFKSKA